MIRWLRAAVAACAAAYLASVLLPGVLRPGDSHRWDVGVNAAVYLGASAVCLHRAGTVAADRAAWACFGAGIASYALGTLVYYAVLAGPDTPFPSVSDALWLLLYPFSLAGIVLLVRARMAGSVASTWLDGVVFGLGLVSLSASLVFPRITAGVIGSAAAVVTNFAYPLLDLALVATVVGAMAPLSRWHDRVWQLLAAGFLVFAAADSWFLWQVAPGPTGPAASSTPGTRRPPSCSPGRPASGPARTTRRSP